MPLTVARTSVVSRDLDTYQLTVPIGSQSQQSTEEQSGPPGLLAQLGAQEMVKLTLSWPPSHLKEKGAADLSCRLLPHPDDLKYRAQK